MDDNVFENSVLFTRDLTLNIFYFFDSNGCCIVGIVSDAVYFSFLKGNRDESFVLNYLSPFEP